jgi:hypothetical protein
MNQLALREALHESTGTAPVSTIDIDATIIRLRHSVRRRRVLAVAAASAAVTGLSLGLVTYLGPSATVNSPPVGPITTWGSAGPSAGPETAEQKATRLSSALQTLVAAALPGATVDPLRLRIVRADAAPEDAPFNFLEKRALVRDGAGTGSISVTIGRRENAPDAAWWCADANGRPLSFDARASRPKDCATPAGLAGGALNTLWFCPDPTIYPCVESTGPHGELVITLQRRSGTSILYEVSVARPDGTAILLDSLNGNDIGQFAPATRPEPPLSVEQLIAIGTDPSLDLRL